MEIEGSTLREAGLGRLKLRPFVGLGIAAGALGLPLMLSVKTCSNPSHVTQATPAGLQGNLSHVERPVVTEEDNLGSDEATEGAPVPGSDWESSSEPEPFPGEHFPETRIRELSPKEVKDWEFKQVRYAINEIFARHGASFKTDYIRKEFEKQSWYNAIPGRNPQNMLELLNQIEKKNLKVLGDRRRELERQEAK